MGFLRPCAASGDDARAVATLPPARGANVDRCCELTSALPVFCLPGFDAAVEGGFLGAGDAPRGSGFGGLGVVVAGGGPGCWAAGVGGCGAAVAGAGRSEGGGFGRMGVGAGVVAAEGAAGFEGVAGWWAG